ncbi:MAG: MOSC N-terminal beta barrel domain-containing protein, partial [Enterobacterales bacterium]|nr:MOSC N-terminal beta barrel domain-containing protein [Enterobacterales bacterium]
MITLSKLYVHPIKSMRGLQLSQAQVLPSGLAFDRALMITETDGT